jgi:hypothetical protein
MIIYFNLFVCLFVCLTRLTPHHVQAPVVECIGNEMMYRTGSPDICIVPVTLRGVRVVRERGDKTWRDCCNLEEYIFQASEWITDTQARSKRICDLKQRCIEAGVALDDSKPMLLNADSIRSTVGHHHRDSERSLIPQRSNVITVIDDSNAQSTDLDSIETQPLLLASPLRPSPQSMTASSGASTQPLAFLPSPLRLVSPRSPASLNSPQSSVSVDWKYFQDTMPLSPSRSTPVATDDNRENVPIPMIARLSVKGLLVHSSIRSADEKYYRCFLHLLHSRGYSLRKHLDSKTDAILVSKSIADVGLNELIAELSNQLK